MQIVEAIFGNETDAQFGYEDLIADKSFLEDYTQLEGNKVRIRASSREKAEKIRRIVKETLGLSKIRIKPVTSESGEDWLSKIKKYQKKAKKYGKQLRRAPNISGVTEGNSSTGTINRAFGELTGRQFYVTATYRPRGRKADEGAEVLSDKGVPWEAVHVSLAEETDFDNDVLQVNCSSKSKAEKVENWLKKETNPLNLKISHSRKR